MDSKTVALPKNIVCFSIAYKRYCLTQASIHQPHFARKCGGLLMGKESNGIAVQQIERIVNMRKQSKTVLGWIFVAPVQWSTQFLRVSGRLIERPQEC